MRWPDLARLRWRLLAANLAVASVGVLTVVAGAWFAAPRAFEEAMGRMGDAMMGGRGSMSGTTGMMDPLLRSAFGDAVGVALLLGIAAAGIVAATASVLLAAHIARPIDELASASRRVASGDFSRPVPGASGELGDLSVSFNEMAAALAANEQRRRDLVGDVAHELRTPIASLRGYVDGLSAGVFAAGPETWRVLADQTARLEHLVDDLALLWRAESEDARTDTVLLDVASELHAAAARHQPDAAARGVNVVVRAPPGLALHADAIRLGQVLDNLVINATRYGGRGGTVDLSARHVPGAVEIAIADDGLGMTAEQVARVFDRFYRADTSRSRDAGGSGLGLAITRTLVRAMHGSVSAESAGVGRGSTFRVRLPTA